MCRTITFIFALVCISSMAFGGTIHVPADQPTIQDGIIAAVNGDVVLVAEGIYYENINFMGKAITVASRFYVDQKKEHIRNTIIDGSQPANPDFGSVVSFVSGEDTNSVLCGFTISGGTGMKLTLPGFPEIRIGGGIACFAAGAKICHNIIKENSVQGSAWGIGGGVSISPPGFPASAIIENNTFTRNEVYGIFNADGGGISNYFQGRIVNNEVFNNYVFCEQGIAAGGGLSSYTARDASAGHVLISGNTVTHNSVVSTTADTIGGIAGGMEIWGFNLTVGNNVISHNTVSSAVDHSYGAGVVLDFPDNNVVFQNNVVSHNTFEGTGGCKGGAIAIWDGHAMVYNNILSQNRASLGAGIWIGIEDTISMPHIINNTFTKNKATIAGGGIYSDKSEPTVMNSILWKNAAPAGSQIFVDGGAINVTYSDVQGGWMGTGNIKKNPKLFGLLLFLGFRSPCIDAGNPDPMYNDPESIFFPGHAQLPARGTVRNDIGAYGGPGAAGWWNFLNFAKELQTAPLEEEPAAAEIDNQEKSIQIDQYPNPFNSQTTFQFELPSDGFVSLKIYNVLGQEVANLVSQRMSAGSHTYVWNANNVASGIYVYRLEVNGKIYQNKLILMK